MLVQKSRIFIGMAVVILLVVGGSVYYLSRDTVSSGETGGSCPTGYHTYAKEDFGFFEEAPVDLEFSYPCDWRVTNFPGTNHMIITAPDNSASFAWPIMNVNMNEFTIDEGIFMTTVNGVEYMGRRYSGTGKTIDFIYVPVTDGSILSGIYTTYSDEEGKEKVGQIVSSISFERGE